jgi:hypothetical protein
MAKRYSRSVNTASSLVVGRSRAMQHRLLDYTAASKA